MPKSFFSRVLIALFLTSAPSFAQSLADVLSSVQERKQAIEQSKQVSWHLNQNYSASPAGGSMPTQILIKWQGLESVKFPSDSDTAGLGIDARIQLLNQAIKELRSVQRSYLNFRKQDLISGAQAGVLRPFMLEDFPDPGRATHECYHQVLRLVAQSVRRLSVLPWPMAGNRRTAYSQSTSQQSIASIGSGGLEEEEPGWELSNTKLLTEESSITLATKVEGGENDTHFVSKTEKFYDKLALFAGVPQSANQLGGKVGAIARNNWSNVPDTSVNVAAPVSWKPGQDGSCVVTLVQVDPSGDHATAGKPAITVQLGWVPESYSWPPFPYPAGCNMNEFACYDLNSWETLLGVGGYAASPPWDQPQLVISRHLTGVFAPSFTKGLDTAGSASLLEKSEKASAPTPGDAQPVLLPTPGMLMAIPLGAGLDGATMGYIGLTPGEADRSLIAYSSDQISPYGYGGAPTVNALPWELANRFDYAASLRFIGPAQDFHVVYETSRDVAKRGAELPLQVPTTQETTDMGCKFFFRNWDLPRLKQVVSRDFIVNITPQGHYKNEVKIYRRPAGAGAVDRTPGAVAGIPAGAQPIRTLILENPDVLAEPNTEEDPYPATPEKLHITDADTLYKIERTGYPEYASKSSGGFGVKHADIYFEIKEGEAVRYSKTMDFQGIGHVISTTAMDGVTVSTETINDQDWGWYLGMEPSNRTIVRGSQTTTVTNTHAANPSPWLLSFRNEWHPLTSEITITNEPTINLVWNASGRLTSAVQGAWRTDYSIESNALKAESKFKTTTYATTWTDWSNHDRTIKTYTAPNGAVSSKTADESNWIELTLGNSSNTGLPGLPHQLTRKDGSGAEWAWTVGDDHSGSVIVTSGQFSGGSLQTGQIQTTAWNDRSYPISLHTSLVASGTVTVANHEVPSNQFSTWGAPTQWKNLLTTLTSVVAYEPGLNRPSSTTSPLGLSSTFSNYDFFERPAQVVSNGITADHDHTALGVSTTYNGSGIATGAQSSFSTNIEGTTVSQGMTWGGVTQSSDIVRGSSSTTLTGSDSQMGSSGATLRNDDDSLSAADSASLAFGGVSGDALSIINGLFVTKSAVADLPGTFAETHTDAWGRTHKIVTPSKSGGSTQTTYDYSLPVNPLKRIITTEPTGCILITESDAAGTITRSGIDKDGNDSLGGSDRYTESSTTVTDGKVVTTLKVTDDPGPGVVNGMREVMESKWTPSSGVTVTKINGNEETITSTPNYTNKTVKVESSKGWERTTGVNELGLATTNTLSGAGIPTTSLTPTWRDDGSLASVSLSIGGETHTANFNPDSTLSSLTAPGRGNILGGHSISNGVESLTVNGITIESSYDGTAKSASGANIIDRDETLVIASGGYKKTVTPTDGASTETAFNAATTPIAKTYADSSSESLGYTGELVSSITLARGGALALDYSNDGAKDLASATWPAVTSGPFTIPSIINGFGYTRSGNIGALSDPSGTRSLSYLNGRLTGTTYTAGLLKGYEIFPARDTVGRHTGTLLKRDGNTIHTTAEAPNGASDQITNLASGNITATPQRDGAGRITGYLWSDGTNSVTQTWTRGAGGRIETATSDVTGAPSFDYAVDENAFDAVGRRLKCETASGTWTYVYGAGGQLTSATHPTLGTFTYQYDGLGRRTDKGTANTTDILNRTTAWTHDQSKNLTIKAHPNARVWFNGVEIENFTGTHSASITPPGTEGGWVPWETLAVLEGAGEGAGNPAPNPLASPDAKAEKKGAVWVPPTAETFTFDAAGNRQSSAQWDFGWDAKNQLARARTKNHTTAAQGYDITFSYDSEGRRVKKHVVEYLNGTQVSEKIITFVWDNWDLLYERHQLPSGLTTLERKYLWGPDIADGSAGGAGGLLLIRETKGNTTTNIIPLYDGGGNVIALTDINKNLLAEYCHGPFGEKISATGTHAQNNPWQWATKYRDQETGLYYFGHRYMDPITGQFLSRDALGENESINLYAYCGGDPINYIDVQGLAAKDVRKHVDQAEKHLAQLTLAMAALVGSSDEEFETMAEDIEAIYGDYLGSVTAGYDEMASFMQEGWLLSFRSADDDLVTDLAAMPTNFAGLKPDRAMTRQWMAAGSQISSSLSGQSNVLNNTHTALVVTEVTADVVLISTGVGAGGVAVRKVLIQQGGKQAAKMVLRGMATATGGLAIGFLSQEAMIKAGMSPEHAKMAMRGAELFFAYKMLKVARLANAAPSRQGFGWVDNIPKNSRPHPAAYMSVAERKAHAALYESGAVRIAPSAPTGTIGRAETWVFPRSVVDGLIKRSNGNVAKLERMLGLDVGYLGKSPVLIDIPSPSRVRIPTGNEFGASPLWRAGGQTSGGIPEAIIDPVRPGDYFTRPVF